MNWVGRLGIAMAITGVVVSVVEVSLLLPAYLRLTKSLKALTLLYEDNLRLTRDELQILSRALDETRRLLVPYRRINRWLTHPVTLALFASYRRRRSVRRSSAPVP